MWCEQECKPFCVESRRFGACLWRATILANAEMNEAEESWHWERSQGYLVPSQMFFSEVSRSANKSACISPSPGAHDPAGLLQVSVASSSSEWKFCPPFYIPVYLHMKIIFYFPVELTFNLTSQVATMLQSGSKIPSPSLCPGCLVPSKAPSGNPCARLQWVKSFRFQTPDLVL